MPSKQRTPWTFGPFAFIPLTQGLVAVIDAKDLPLAAGRLWYAQRIGKSLYAAANPKRAKGGARGGLIYLHRVILRHEEGEIDHRDGDGLNNTRRNLRPATHRQNAQNRTKPKNNRSGHEGVCWDKAVKKWKAYLRAEGKQIHLGYFDSLEAAVDERKVAARHRYGSFYRE